jgi:hypothetical protein
VLTIGDLPDLAAALAPRPVRLEGLIDGYNRRLTDAAAREAYQATQRSYRQSGHADNLKVGAADGSPSQWVVGQLTR